MLESHRTQIHKGVAESLAEAGIGRRYHSRSLAEIPGGAELIAWLKTPEGRQDVRDGVGLTFLGSGAKAYDGLILAAKAVHVVGIKAAVLTLNKVALAATEGSYLDLIEDAEVLAVTTFTQRYGKSDACPLTGWQASAVENFLIDRLDDGRPTFLHAAAPLESWWSALLVNRVANSNRLVKVEG